MTRMAEFPVAELLSVVDGVVIDGKIDGLLAGALVKGVVVGPGVTFGAWVGDDDGILDTLGAALVDGAPVGTALVDGIALVVGVPVGPRSRSGFSPLK